jgi:hypothetical protein
MRSRFGEVPRAVPPASGRVQAAGAAAAEPTLGWQGTPAPGIRR